MKKSILLFCFTILLVDFVNACICDRQTLQERIDEYHFIFIGKVLSVEDIYSDSTAKWPDRQQIVIKIDRKFKGNQSEIMIIESQLSTCASYFEKGQSYLVFADHYITNETMVNENFVAMNDKIVTGKCYGTKGIDRSENEIRELKEHFN
jgi:hypothetical protein